jgi:hypothetical protein
MTTEAPKRFIVHWYIDKQPLEFAKYKFIHFESIVKIFQPKNKLRISLNSKDLSLPPMRERKNYFGYTKLDTPVDVILGRIKEKEREREVKSERKVQHIKNFLSINMEAHKNQPPTPDTQNSLLSISKISNPKILSHKDVSLIYLKEEKRMEKALDVLKAKIRDSSIID